MIIKRITGCTRELGRAQGYRPLPVRDAKASNGAPFMETAWEPTPDELERLNKGATVRLLIAGIEHPPVKIEVGPVEA